MLPKKYDKSCDAYVLAGTTNENAAGNPARSAYLIDVFEGVRIKLPIVDQ